MRKRINPSLIIVRGKPIKGMNGRFIFVGFDDTFEVKKDWQQLRLFELIQIYEIKEAD